MSFHCNSPRADFFDQIKHCKDNRLLNSNDFKHQLSRFVDECDDYEYTPTVTKSAFDYTNESIMDMDAMERSLSLQKLIVSSSSNTLSQNILKIDNKKDQLLIALLYKVCSDIDPTMKKFLHACLQLYDQKVIKDLTFLKFDNNNTSPTEPNNDLMLNKGNFYKSQSCPKLNKTQKTKSTFNSDLQKMSLMFEDDWNDSKCDPGSESESDSEFATPEIAELEFEKEKKQDLYINLDVAKSTSIGDFSTPIKNNIRLGRYNRDFSELELIGYGAYGTVHKVQHNLDDMVYAIKKIIYKSQGFNDQSKQEILREVRSLAVLNHANVVRYYTAWIEPLMSHKNKANRSGSGQFELTHLKTLRSDGYVSDASSDFDVNDPNFCSPPFLYSRPLQPEGNYPIARAGMNDSCRSLLKYNESNGSFVSPFPSRHVTPRSTLHRRLSWASASMGSLDFEVYAPAPPQDENENVANAGESRILLKNILTDWEAIYHYSCLYLQTEFCGKYTLKAYLEDEKRIANREHNMHIFSQILLGLVHIHSHAILHRDLKPENIFLVANRHRHWDATKSPSEVSQPDPVQDIEQFAAKIGDFGLAKSIFAGADNIEVDPKQSAVGKSTVHTSNIGTAIYAAPEQLANNSNEYGPAADIYSLGVILFEMLHPAFKTMSEKYMTIKKLREQKYNFGDDFTSKQRSGFADEIKLIQQMTDPDASKRPTAFELASNPFLQIFWMKNVINSAMPGIPHFSRLSKNAPTRAKHVETVDAELKETVEMVEIEISEK